jgi:NTE family protein
VKLVLVCGGGGAKALACAGAWRAIAEAGHQVVQLVGTSLGAVVAAAFAAGVSPDWLASQIASVSRQDIARVSPFNLVRGVFAPSLLKAQPLKDTIARLVPATRFADLKIPLTVTATDLDSGELVLFGALGQDAPLVEVLYASCALPVYYPPAELAGRRLVDGGLRAVLPIYAARRVPADAVLAVHSGPGFDEVQRGDRTAPIPPLIRAHGEAERVMMAAQTERDVAAWPEGGPKLIVVRPVAEKEATFALSEIPRFIASGYEATKRALA